MLSSLDTIIEQQYVLARKCNMPISETNRMAYFEMEAFLNIFMKELEEENKSMSK